MSPSVLPLTLTLTLCALTSFPFSNAKPSYAPKTNQACPDSLLRQTSGSDHTLNPNELQYLGDRRKLFPDAWRDWVGDGTHLGYDLDNLKMTAYDPSGLPVIGIAISGGGWRAAQAGAGILSALDARNATAKTKGTGGLLQVSSYLTGLSGGSWLVSSMLFNNFPDLHDLALGDTDKGGSLNGWLLEKDLLSPNGPNASDPQNALYFGNILGSVIDKGKTGIDISLTDIWSGGLAYHFLSGLGDPNSTDTITTEENFFANDTSHGAGIIWSNMINIPTFQKREFPLPILGAAARTPVTPGVTQAALNSTQFEFTPWEFGSYDPDLSSFVDVKFLGSHLVNGKPANASACVTEFDQTSFIFGTSSSLFHRPGQVTQFLAAVLQRLSALVPSHAGDVGNYPNPFQGVNPDVYQDSQSTILEVVDGGDAGEIVPLAPLLVKPRQLDVIVAVDASSDDTDFWPQGFSIYAARNRTQQVTASVVQEFPPIPSIQADFGRLGLNRRPTFFGCDPKEYHAEFPLLVYIPNAPPVDGSDPVTNVVTERAQFQPGHTSLILDQGQSSGFSGFLEGQLGADDGFPICLQCAAVDRARLKTYPITPRSDICSKCFQKYCFDPANPPPEGQIVGRKFQFKEPGPFGPI